MRGSCKACLHERRAEIDQAIREGIAYRIIAEGFDLGLATISRHKDHMEQLRNKTEQDGTLRRQMLRKVIQSNELQLRNSQRNKAEQSGTRRNSLPAMITPARRF